MDLRTWQWLCGAVILILLCKAWQRWPRSQARGQRRRLVLGLLLAPWFARAQTSARRSEAQADAEGVLATVWLHNTANAEQPGSFVSPMFGHPFKQGDIPAGSYPQFALTTGEVCAATLWAVSSWPDGSMKFCAVMLRLPQAIKGSNRMPIQVRAGGARPVPGPRTTADLLQADLRVELTGVEGLDGVWTASLSDGVRRRDDLVLLGSGAAGSIWRIGSELRDGRGAPHGQLYCWHYVAALNGADDRLLGLRYLGRVAQPWADVATPAPRHRDCSAVLKSGATTIRALQGHTDSEMPGEVIRLPHYASFFTAGPDATWDYVQGGGSAAVDGTVRVMVDVPYAQSTDVIPPVVLAGEAQEASVSHHPMGRGAMVRYMPQTGGRSDIGLIPLWCVRYLADQSELNERAVRVNASVAAGWRIAYRKRSTRQVVAISDLRPRYAGLGTIETKWRIYSNQNQGFSNASPNKTLWTEDNAHRPQPFLVAYVFTGEPQYLDLAIDSALTLISGLAPNVRTLVTAFPTKSPSVTPWVGDRDIRIGVDGPVFKCAGQMFIGGRVGAWGTRDTAMCALLPDTPPDGAEVRLYMRDIVDSMYAALLAYRDRMPASYSNSGLILTQANGGDDRSYENPWQTMYWSFSICWQSGIFKTPNAAPVRRYFLQFYKRASALFDIGCVVAYRMAQYDDNENLIQRMEDAVFLAGRRLKLDSVTDTVEVLPRQGNEMYDWTPTNGDILAFSKDQMTGKPNPFPQFGRNKRLYVVNAQRLSFQLAASPGGAPLDITTDQTIGQFMGQFQQMGARTVFANDPVYISLLRGLLVYHERMGDPAAEVRAAFEPKALAAGFDPDALSQFNIAERNAPGRRLRGLRR